MSQANPANRTSSPHLNRPLVRLQTASSFLFFFAKLLHAKPKHASGQSREPRAASREKRGRKPEKKK